jgi:hypothetical protein
MRRSAKNQGEGRRARGAELPAAGGLPAGHQARRSGGLGAAALLLRRRQRVPGRGPRQPSAAWAARTDHERINFAELELEGDAHACLHHRGSWWIVEAIQQVCG